MSEKGRPRYFGITLGLFAAVSIAVLVVCSLGQGGSTESTSAPSQAGMPAQECNACDARHSAMSRAIQERQAKGQGVLERLEKNKN